MRPPEGAEPSVQHRPARRPAAPAQRFRRRLRIAERTRRPDPLIVPARMVGDALPLPAGRRHVISRGRQRRVDLQLVLGFDRRPEPRPDQRLHRDRQIVTRPAHGADDPRARSTAAVPRPCRSSIEPNRSASSPAGGTAPPPRRRRRDGQHRTHRPAASSRVSAKGGRRPHRTHDRASTGRTGSDRVRLSAKATPDASPGVSSRPPGSRGGAGTGRRNARTAASAAPRL